MVDVASAARKHDYMNTKESRQGHGGQGSGVAEELRGWLDGTHRQTLSLITRASLEGMARDLGRHSDRAGDRIVWCH